MVLAGVGILLDFFYIFDGDEALQVPLGVHHEKLFDPVSVQQLFGFLKRTTG